VATADTGCIDTTSLLSFFREINPPEETPMNSGGPFLNIKAPKDLLDRLDDYRFATRKPSRAEAARELLDQALKAFFEVSPAEQVRPGDPDYALVRARRRQPIDAFPIREIEARLARLKKARAG
jgi:hypothetical protein